MPEERRSTTAEWIALAIVLVGALNWLLVGLFELDLVAALFGVLSPAARAVYILVGVAGLGLLALLLMRRGALLAPHDEHVRIG